MIIDSVTANNRKRVFEIREGSRDWVFPYARAELMPSSADPIADVWVDEELGSEAFTYRLRSGAEDSIHFDEVLEYNRDPEFLANLALYKLTVEARHRLDASGLSVREVTRMLDTSQTQLYRLLDTTNYAKSAGQLFRLLYLLGWMGPGESVSNDAVDSISSTSVADRIDHLDEGIREYVNA